ncbi:MAG TPA: nucleotidyl transferase AbiEii/AbiGii toxin family protein [Myxococcota bacterium]|nr:nucleotidyl transferase AbiEii/AbiGii toxin family protein [Myxococcota bacterium]HOD08791.1 nucleotidyl transferase AbiEii/AbiGii toxin family protein [Myxococcota bacterium]
MSLLDIVVDQALKNRPDLTSLRTVVEKELIHHDILRIMSENGFLDGLVFMGGTCLRLCHGSVRCSEDLDFAGGAGFDRTGMQGLSKSLSDGLTRKYGVVVSVGDPVRDSGNTDTWRIRIQTRPDRPDIPAQRINIDICAIPAREPTPQMLINPYGVDMGTSGLIIRAESRQEIFVDKLVAFAVRRGRVKQRDIWDIGWLHRCGVSPRMDLLRLKLSDHGWNDAAFLSAYEERLSDLGVGRAIRDFQSEMRRFLAGGDVAALEEPGYWIWLTGLLSDYAVRARDALRQ